jgi:hypothetical protein
VSPGSDAGYASTMRIGSFVIENFRSIERVEVNDLGPFVVMYGKNGAGKSNILQALAWAFRMREFRSDDQHAGASPYAEVGFVGSELGGLPATFSDTTLIRWRGPDEEVDVGWSNPEFRAGALRYSWLDQGQVDGTPLPESLRAGMRSSEPAGFRTAVDDVNRAVRWFSSSFALVNAVRGPLSEARLKDEPGFDFKKALAGGRLAEALFRAQNSPEWEIRSRYKRFQQFMQGPPLHRPPFVAVEYPDGRFELREELHGGGGRDVPLDLAGLGVFQLYSIMAQILISGATVVAIEEPEAHLHAPTSGRDLRQLLVRLVEEKHVEQIFVATHSNLFDLDPERYLDVSLDEHGRTVAAWKPLTEIDREHLYEPGPAKHALQAMLRYSEPDVVVFRRPDGAPVTATEMLTMLQTDDQVALEFLADIHGGVMRTLRARAKRSA